MAKVRRGVGFKDDGGKLRYDLVPPSAIRALADILTYGAQKYAPEGWRTVPNARARYTAALMRHLEAWRGGEILDPESGRPHLHHLLCNAAVLVEMDETGGGR